MWPIKILWLQRVGYLVSHGVFSCVFCSSSQESFADETNDFEGFFVWKLWRITTMCRFRSLCCRSQKLRGSPVDLWQYHMPSIHHWCNQCWMISDKKWPRSPVAMGWKSWIGLDRLFVPGFLDVFHRFINLVYACLCYFSLVIDETRIFHGYSPSEL